MYKQMTNTAIALLVTLGMAACSINTGIGSQGRSELKIPPNVNGDRQQNSPSEQDREGENRGPVVSSSSSHSATTPVRLSHATSGEYGKGYLNSPETKNQLLEKIATLQNVTSGTCSNVANSVCSARQDSITKAGDVMLAYKQSYSSYAVVREKYQADNRTVPTNAYLAVVITPTQDIAAVTDATYKGQASFSSDNRPNVRTVAALTLNVTNQRISGELTQDTSTSSGLYPTLITFNTADIQVQEGQVGFSGKAQFHKRAFSQDMEGTYQGWFAGEKAEEVIGTFETNEPYAQGAFAGKR